MRVYSGEKEDKNAKIEKIEKKREKRRNEENCQINNKRVRQQVEE